MGTFLIKVTTHPIHEMFISITSYILFMVKRSSIAHLPLHGGHAPQWLIKRMTKLADAILTVIVDEYGVNGLLRRLSDSFWFQSLGCVLGYDWHSSGVTTVTTGVLKTVLSDSKYEIAAAGGKGHVSLKTPNELKQIGERFQFSDEMIKKLQFTSKMVAKVDNTAVQDGFNLYHHTMFVTIDGKWAIIQQGMDPDIRVARRYHWLHDNVKSFVNEPHTMIVTEIFKESVLDMTSRNSAENRKVCLDLIKDRPDHIKQYFFYLRDPKQMTLESNSLPSNIVLKKRRIPALIMPKSLNWTALERAYELDPKNYEELLGIEGIGPATVRSLALIAELIWGAQTSWKDPAKFSFAHGGKDGVPYPVNIKRMEEVTEALKSAIEEAKIGNKDKFYALKRLAKYTKKKEISQS